MQEQGPDMASASQILAEAYTPGSEAIRNLHRAMQRAGRAGTSLVRSVALNMRSRPVANPNGTFSLAARALTADGREIPFAAIARKREGRWRIDGAAIAGRDGKTPFMAPADDGLAKARSEVAKGRSAMDESARLGAHAPDSSLNAHNDAKLAASQAALKARAPERGPKPSGPDEIETLTRGSGRTRGGGLLSIIASAGEILEAIDPRAVPSNPTSRTLRLFASSARLPSGNEVTGSESPLAGVAASLDGRKPLHEVHLSIDAMKKTLSRDARRPMGSQVADDSLGSLIQSIERSDAREAAAPGMERAMSGKSASR